MTTVVAIDKAGRLILPKPVRERLHLRAGDKLEIESEEDRITLRPVREAARLRRKQGIWVISGGEPITAEDTREAIETVRREREAHLLGKKL